MRGLAVSGRSQIVEVARACTSIGVYDQPFVVLAEWKTAAEETAAGCTGGEDLDGCARRPDLPGLRRLIPAAGGIR